MVNSGANDLKQTMVNRHIMIGKCGFLIFILSCAADVQDRDHHAKSSQQPIDLQSEGRVHTP